MSYHKDIMTALVDNALYCNLRPQTQERIQNIINSVDGDNINDAARDLYCLEFYRGMGSEITVYVRSGSKNIREPDGIYKIITEELQVTWPSWGSRPLEFGIEFLSLLQDVIEFCKKFPRQTRRVLIKTNEQIEIDEKRREEERQQTEIVKNLQESLKENVKNMRVGSGRQVILSDVSKFSKFSNGTIPLNINNKQYELSILESHIIRKS